MPTNLDLFADIHPAVARAHHAAQGTCEIVESVWLVAKDCLASRLFRGERRSVGFAEMLADDVCDLHDDVVRLNEALQPIAKVFAAVSHDCVTSKRKDQTYTSYHEATAELASEVFSRAFTACRPMPTFGDGLHSCEDGFDPDALYGLIVEQYHHVRRAIIRGLTRGWKHDDGWPIDLDPSIATSHTNLPSIIELRRAAWDQLECTVGDWTHYLNELKVQLEREATRAHYFCLQHGIEEDGSNMPKRHRRMTAALADERFRELIVDGKLDIERVTIRDAAKAVGCAEGTIGKTDTWKRLMANRQNRPREVPLQDVVERAAAPDDVLNHLREDESNAEFPVTPAARKTVIQRPQ